MSMVAGVRSRPSHPILSSECDIPNDATLTRNTRSDVTSPAPDNRSDREELQ